MMRATLRAAIAAVLVVLLLPAPPARGEDPLDAAALTDEHLRAAIDAIVTELYDRRGDPGWEPRRPPSGESQRQGGGTTALVVQALLSAGQSYQDPRLRDAVELLEGYAMEGTYAVAVRAHVWAELPASFAPKLEADARWLLESFSTRSLCWDYGHDPRASYQDNSLRQYGALGLWEAAKRGVPVPPRLWQGLEHAIVQAQLPDGGWNYRGDQKPPRGSMTAAGLTILFIAQDLLHATERAAIDERRDAAPHELAIERGLGWMDANFSATEHPGSPAYFYYYLYGVERVGLASGYRTFGGRDWFRAGAAELLARLCDWDPQRRTMAVHARERGRSNGATTDTRDLAFALMFLSRGRVPVAVNKLRADDAAWNNRPRDAANLVRWLSDRSERELSWQIVDTSDDPNEWLDAPFLYLASHRAVPWAGADGATDLDPTARKLKTYLDAGGLLLAVAEGSGRPFAESIRELGTRLYPDLQWRPVPGDHWIYELNERVPPRQRFFALGNGVRELILLAPTGDLSRSFQSTDPRRADALRIAANVYYHASELDRPRPRLGVAPEAARSDPAPSGGLARCTLVRAQHGGAWNPEPAALPAFARWLERTRGVRPEILRHPLAEIDRLEATPALVVVSGVDAPDWSDAERDALRRYVESGGTVLFETTGGVGGLAADAERMAVALFGAPSGLLLETPIVTGDGLPDGSRLTTIAYRPFSLTRMGGRETAPRLRGIRVNGAPRVLFSDEDLGHALLDQPCWGISGYATHDARRLLWNVVQHAATVGRTGTVEDPTR